MHPMQEFARRTPNLVWASGVCVEGTGQFLVHRDHVYMGTTGSGGAHLSIIDGRDPRELKLLHTMKFKEDITSVALHGETLVAAESNRALNFINIENPAEPDYFDCGVALGTEFNNLAVVDGFAVVGLHRGVGVMDVRDPAEARWTDRKELGRVMQMIVLNDLIFTVDFSEGLRMFTLRDGKLFESAQPLDEEFDVRQIFAVGNEVWVFGSSEDGHEELVVIEPAVTLDRLKCTFVCECQEPKVLLPLQFGGAVGFGRNHTCLGYDPVARCAGEIFNLYTRDKDGTYFERPADTSALTLGQEEALDVSSTRLDQIRYAVRKGDFVLAALEKEFVAFSIPEGSVFASTVSV